MLVLTRTRSKDSAVTIGDFITINIVEWSDIYKVVKLAFLTTKPISIRRQEVVDRQNVAPRMGNLVLSRREGEVVLLGENIRIEVKDISSTRCSIGIDAPREIPIVRVEAKVPEELEEI